MTVASPFMPKQGSNQKVTAAITSATVSGVAGNKSLRIVNTGNVVVYVRTGNGTVTATAADTPISAAGSAGSVLVIEKPQDHDVVAYLADSTTSVMHIQPGEGGG